MQKKILDIFLVLFIIVAIVCLLGAGYYYFITKQEEDTLTELKPIEYESSTDTNETEIDEKLDYYMINEQIVQEKFKTLYLRNQDFIGWLCIEDTAIDYPVMQTPDDEQYYIKRDFDGNYSSSGSIFADISSNIQTPSDNILLYGHNMNTGTMFKALLNYENQEWFKKHPYIQFDTLYKDTTYKVIAAFRTKIYTNEYEGFVYYDFFNATNEEDFNNYVSNIKQLSSIQSDESVSYGDELLSLSTCAYHTDNGRFVVVAKKIDEKEIDMLKDPIEVIQLEK